MFVIEHRLIHFVVFGNEIIRVEIFRIPVRMPRRYVKIIVGIHGSRFVCLGRIKIAVFPAENIIVDLL